MVYEFFLPVFLSLDPPKNPANSVGINKVGRPVDGILDGEAGVEEYEWTVGLILILEIIFGVGVVLVFVVTVTGELLFFPIFLRSIFFVTTAKKTITTTSPRMKEIILFKPSIWLSL